MVPCPSVNHLFSYIVISIIIADIITEANKLNLKVLKTKDIYTLLGKPVIISNEMPDAEAGKKPVLFGDLSYYWFIDRTPAIIILLKELFAANVSTDISPMNYLMQSLYVRML